jgi:hypothetical protein
MGRIKDLRDALITDLEVVGVPVMDDWQVRAEPPCILVGPARGGPYVTPGLEFTSYVLSTDVIVLVEMGPDARDRLETLIENVLVNSVDWALGGVDTPPIQSVEDSTVEFLSSAVHLEKGFYL